MTSQMRLALYFGFDVVATLHFEALNDRHMAQVAKTLCSKLTAAHCLVSQSLR